MLRLGSSHEPVSWPGVGPEQIRGLSNSADDSDHAIDKTTFMQTYVKVQSKLYAKEVLDQNTSKGFL